MTIAALGWPAASLYIALIVSVALVLAVLIWSIFRTGQTAIRSDARQREPVDNPPKKGDESRARLARPIPPTATGEGSD